MPKLAKEKRDQLILVIIGTVAVTVGLWYGVIKTRNEQLAECAGRRQTAVDKVEKARARVKQAQKVEAEMKLSTQRLKEVEDSMAPGADLYRWAYVLLERARAGHDVTIIDVTRPARGEIGMLAQFPYDGAIFSVRGSAYYHEFGKFLADFENKFPYFRVQNLLLGPGPEGASGSEAVGRSGDERLQFKVEVVALIQPSP